MDLGFPTARQRKSGQEIIKRFLGYAEIKTKITSVFPFLLGLAYLYSTGCKIDPLKTIVFFLGMFCFDLTATMINNYCDTKKNRQTLPFARRPAQVMLLLLFTVSVIFGLFLVYLSDPLVLVAGVLCFGFGVVYSYGPVPISHGPYGEIVAGFFYGLVIPALLFYINLPAGEFFAYTLRDGKLFVGIELRSVVGLLLLSVLPFCLTANIMLANNICDVERDVAVNRYTLPYYLGEKALWLFAALYYLAYLSVLAMVAWGYLPPLCLLLLFTLVPVQKNIKLFFRRQSKEETFIVAIKNFLIVITLHTLLIFFSSFLPGWGPR